MRINPRAVGVAATLAVVALASWLVLKHRLGWHLLPTVAAIPQPAVVIDTPLNHGPTVIAVSSTILHSGVKRLGMNLGNQDFYDSQQILQNLVSRNPGFEGRMWQTVILCGNPTAKSCVDAAGSGTWPEGFMDGATYEIVSGASAGVTGTVVHSTASNGQTGTRLELSPKSSGQPSGSAHSEATNEFIVVRKVTTGDATDGWAVQANAGASVVTELKDLAPQTSGLQAVRIRASLPGQYVSFSQFFDSTAGHTYVRMHGPYVIRFRAKGVSGNRSVDIKLQRSGEGGGSLFDKHVQLGGVWQDYSVSFNTAEPAFAAGTAALTFTVSGGEVLMDDVSLTEAQSNGTAFRNSVVSTLQRLKPGILRYMDSGQNFGCSLDNMLAPQFGRRRCGFNRYLTDTNDIPIGLHDFLVLSEKLGAEPWYTLQLGMSTEETAHLMEYLGGPVSTHYGGLRAQLGHPAPWTTTFPMIHLEFGNEAWNTAQPGAAMADAVAYAERATTIFKVVRSSHWYEAKRFNLIANAQSVNLWSTSQLLPRLINADSIDIAPYLFGNFADDSSIEHIFGPMFAEPQLVDSTSGGDVHKQANAAATAARPVHLAIYETNMGTIGGTASQASINHTVPSIGAGIATIDHMLLMLRDLGITAQNTFQLGGGDYPFTNASGAGGRETSPVWGVAIDMGGSADRVRPSFLAQQLANETILPTMLATSIRGEDPTWNQPRSPNDKVELSRVHELQSFAFTDASTSTLLVINLSRNSAHTVRVAGSCAPQGDVTVRTLTSGKITDSNENSDTVKITTREEHGIIAGESVLSLPPFSITSLSSPSHGCQATR
jgi:alpha-L-arabinofuranosidase